MTKSNQEFLDELKAISKISESLKRWLQFECLYDYEVYEAMAHNLHLIDVHVDNMEKELKNIT